MQYERVNHCTGTVLGAEVPDHEQYMCSPLCPQLLPACWLDRPRGTFKWMICFKCNALQNLWMNTTGHLSVIVKSVLNLIIEFLIQEFISFYIIANYKLFKES